MRLQGLIAPATSTQRFADDCDLSSFEGKPVTFNFGRSIGTVIRAWVKDGSVWAEMDIEDESIAAFLSSDKPLPNG